MMWLTTPGAYWFVVLTAVVGYALPGYLTAVVLFALLHRRAPAVVRGWYAGGALLAVGGLAFQIAVAAPAYVGPHATGEPDLTVMTLNLREGEADPAETVSLVREHGVDVLVLAEVTPAARERLRSARLDELLPHVGGRAREGSSGTMVFSSYRLSAEQQIASRNGAYRISVAAPRGSFELVAVHTSQPLDLPAEWAKDWRAINRAVAAVRGPLIVAGDFNATLEHRPVRDLLDHDLRDAAERANSAWQPTWPGLPGLAGIITIDHVVHDTRFDAISTTTARVTGTDHRALVAELSDAER